MTGSSNCLPMARYVPENRTCAPFGEKKKNLKTKAFGI